MAKKGLHGSYISVTILAVVDGIFVAADDEQIYMFDNAKVGETDYCFASDDKAERHIGTKVSVSSWDFVFNKKRLKKVVKDIK